MGIITDPSLQMKYLYFHWSQIWSAVSTFNKPAEQKNLSTEKNQVATKKNVGGNLLFAKVLLYRVVYQNKIKFFLSHQQIQMCVTKLKPNLLKS